MGTMGEVYQMGTTGVPNGYHGCTKWLPRVYTKWVPRVYQMGTTGVPHGYHGCTKWFHGCTKWGSGKRNGVAKRCWALWRCVFVCVKGGHQMASPSLCTAAVWFIKRQVPIITGNIMSSSLLQRSTPTSAEGRDAMMSSIVGPPYLTDANMRCCQCSLLVRKAAAIY